MTYAVIARPAARVDGLDKVSGQTVYAADVTLPGALWTKVLRSSLPHARIVSLDTSAASAVPGVRAVLTGRDVASVRVGLRMRDMPILAIDKVRFSGEAVAAVAADTPEAAEEAIEAIRVEYEELPGVYDPVAALEEGTTRIHDDPVSYVNAPDRPEDLPNLQSFTVWQHGDLAEGFSRAAQVFEDTFETPLTHHGYLEPHACTVWVHPDGPVEAWASNKGPYSLRDLLVNQLGAPQGKVTIHVLPVGGDFGGKSSLLDVPLCYFLSRQTGRPVKLVLSHMEEMMASGHRHPGAITLRTGISEDGAITAMDATVHFAGGAYAAFKANVQVAVMGARQVGSCYRVPAVRVQEYCAYTNQVPCTQTRTPGSPQTVFAVESHLDLIARRLGMDPMEFRLKNVLTAGETSSLGVRWTNVRAKDVLEAAARSSQWDRPKASPHQGRGVAMYERGSGAGRSNAALSVAADGFVTMTLTIPECGTGAYTVVQQIVGETLGVGMDQVKVEVGNTNSFQSEAGLGGSKTTNSTGRAAFQAAQALLEDLKQVAADHMACNPESVQHQEGRFIGPEEQSLSFQDAASLAFRARGGPATQTATFEPAEAPPVTSFCAQVAEVEVDPETGAVSVERLVTVHDVGTVLNPVTHQGQINGGIVQGFGFGVMEDMTMAEGRIQALHLGDFKLPTGRDIPRLETVLLTAGQGPTPFQGKAIGELPNVPAAAAIANAVHDAVGVRVHDLPVTAEKVHRLLRLSPSS